MNRIPALEPTTTGAARPLLDAVQAKLGAVPNMFRVLGNAPVALRGFLGLNAALAEGELTAGQREQIALAVAESNRCAYCLSAHSFLARKVGLQADDLDAARRASASDTRTDALLKLARAIVETRGAVASADLDRARAAGVTDAEVVETLANVALNVFSNYLNRLAGTAIDFPEVRPAHEAVSASR